MELMLGRLVFSMTRDADFASPEGSYQTGRPLARRLAALELSPGVVIAIAVGGAVFVFVVLSIIMAVVLRVRQRHQLAMSRTARQRRLGMYTGGLPMGGESSFVQGPRPRNVLRRNSQAPYMPNNGWRAISSRESLPHKPLLKGLTRAFVVDGRQSKQDRPRRSWPLPARHKLGSAIPLVHLEGSPLSAITEKSANISAPSPEVGKIAELPAENSPRLTPEKSTEQEILGGQDASHSEMWRTTPPRPRPLFHGYDDKRSAGRVSQVSVPENYESIGPIMDAVQSGATLERPTRPRPVSRSVSHCSQQSGLAPDEPMPPLPLRTPATATQRQHIFNPEDSPSRYSSASFETANSSILGDRDSKPFSQTGTDLTSDLASPPLSFRNSKDPRKHEVGFNSWNSTAMINPNLPLGRQILRGFNQNQLLAMSTRMRDSQQTCSRDSSSGLSMDLADQLDSATPRRAQSNASRLEGSSREISRAYGISFLRTPTPIARDSFSRRHSYYGPNPSRRSSYQGSSYQGSVSDTPEDLRSKRASTSALQDVSGNRMSPTRTQSQQRPYSLPSTNVCQDSRLLTIPSALKGRSGFHKRRNSVRICTLAPIIIESATFPPTVEEPEESPGTPTHPPRIPGLTLRRSYPHPLPQPPSSTTFNPRISPSSDFTPTCQALPLPPEGTHYPAHSILGLYPTSPTSPTKRSRASSEDSLFNPKTDRTPNKCRKHLSNTSSTWSAHGIPTPTMRSFPNPPLTTGHPPPLFQLPYPSTPTPPPRNRDRDRTRSRTPSIIHGPRSQPPRSPTRSPAMKHTHNHSPSDGRDLRRNVLALRHMNSEIGGSASNVVGAKRHSRMGSPSPSVSPSPLGRERQRGSGLSLETETEEGERSPARKILKGCGDDGELELEFLGRGGEVRNSGVGEPKTPQKAVVGLGLGSGNGAGARVLWGTPGSMYDRDGFLKE